MYSKKPKTAVENLIFVETQKLQEKCGGCDGELFLSLYWTKSGYQQQIKCQKCGLEIWREVKRES